MARTVLKSLNESLHQMMAQDPRVVVLGEDLLDPYGGAFKVTKGLSTKFEDRVWTTPISEAGFVGVATGMALRGLRPIVEIMFGDFVMLAADQLINHAAKFRWMYGDQVDVPLVVRLPMGGRRGYGPTHSQTLEKHLMGVPGLAVVAINPLVDPGAMLTAAVCEDDRPLLFIENKQMYARPLQPVVDDQIGPMWARQTAGPYPTVRTGFGSPAMAQVTVVAYGGMVEVALAAAKEMLIEQECYVEVVVPTALYPLAAAPILESLATTGRLVVCEEACGAAGFGAEVCAVVCEKGFDRLQAAPVRVTAREVPIANAPPLEEAILPGVDDVVAALSAVLEQGGPSLRVANG